MNSSYTNGMKREWKSRACNQTAALAKWNAILLQFVGHTKAHTLSFSLKFHQGSWHVVCAAGTWKTQPQIFFLILEEKQRQKNIELFVTIHQLFLVLTSNLPPW
jgi:hypothetical protein